MKNGKDWIELCEEELKRRILYISVSAEFNEVYGSVLKTQWREEEVPSSEGAID